MKIGANASPNYMVAHDVRFLRGYGRFFFYQHSEHYLHEALEDASPEAIEDLIKQLARINACFLLRDPLPLLALVQSF